VPGAATDGADVAGATSAQAAFTGLGLLLLLAAGLMSIRVRREG
jgi:LPXTG-motif cell wall-anchored protein